MTDAITRHLKLARKHFDNILVLNPWCLVWSKVYRADDYVDPTASMLRRGRYLDSRPAFHRVCSDRWRMLLGVTSVVWERRA